MPITPIEVAAMVPKSQDASIHRQQQTQKPINEQIQIHKHINAEIKHNNQQTVKTQKGDNPEYRYDAKEKGNNNYPNSKQNKNKKEKNEKNQNPNNRQLPGSIDIRI
jgi:hypothetical protein